MKSSLIAMLFLAGGSVFAQAHSDFRPAQRQDIREDYRDLGRDQARADHLRADIARERLLLNQARLRHDWRRAQDLQRDLNRDQKALDVLLRNMARDRHDVHHDQRDLYR
jgi:hypothetical protein